jgi:hypothetical protein
MQRPVLHRRAKSANNRNERAERRDVLASLLGPLKGAPAAAFFPRHLISSRLWSRHTILPWACYPRLDPFITCRLALPALAGSARH